MKKLYPSILICLIIVGIWYLFIGPPMPPKPVITVNGTRVSYIRSSYSWRFLFYSLNSHGFNAHEHIDSSNLTPLSVDPGSKLTIKFRLFKPERIRVLLHPTAEEGIEQSMEGNSIILPSRKGKHIYSIIAGWNQGYAVYCFTINIK